MNGNYESPTFHSVTGPIIYSELPKRQEVIRRGLVFLVAPVVLLLSLQTLRGQGFGDVLRTPADS